MGHNISQDRLDREEITSAVSQLHAYLVPGWTIDPVLGSKLTTKAIRQRKSLVYYVGMSDTIRRSRTETYELTIAGLLTKRADLFNEAERMRDRLAEIKNDVDAIDRVLGTFGYTGNLDAEMPRQKRQVLFGSGELTRAILNTLRDADGPMTSREIGRSIMAVRGQDARDRKFLAEVTRRVSKALRALREDDVVRPANDQRDGITWCFRTNAKEGVTSGSGVSDSVACRGQLDLRQETSTRASRHPKV